MLVVDVSDPIEVLHCTPAAMAVESQIFAPGQTSPARPPDPNRGGADLRRYAAEGDINSERGRSAPEDLADLHLQRDPHAVLLPRI